MTALLKLAERCEREESSNILDHEIWKATRLTDGCAWVHYTSSLDAAMTLAPWVLLNLSDIGPSGMFYCRLGETVAPCREVVSEGARTLVLALCAAALRARAAA